MFIWLTIIVSLLIYIITFIAGYKYSEYINKENDNDE